MTRTGWYGYQQKPVRIGVYKTRAVIRDKETGELVVGRSWYSFYDGRSWHWSSNSRGGAKQFFVMVAVSTFQNRIWQGVSK